LYPEARSRTEADWEKVAKYRSARLIYRSSGSPLALRGSEVGRLVGVGSPTGGNAWGAPKGAESARTVGRSGRAL